MSASRASKARRTARAAAIADSKWPTTSAEVGPECSAGEIAKH